MNITDIRIRKINATGKMKAIVSVTFDDMFVVHDMKIIEGANGPFIAMPSRKTPSGEYKDIAHPINTETREMIQTAILGEYNKLPEEEEYVATPAESLEDDRQDDNEEDTKDSPPPSIDSL